jgi:hypothetical protein
MPALAIPSAFWPSAFRQLPAVCGGYAGMPIETTRIVTVSQSIETVGNFGGRIDIGSFSGFVSFPGRIISSAEIRGDPLDPRLSVLLFPLGRDHQQRSVDRGRSGDSLSVPSRSDLLRLIAQCGVIFPSTE